MSPMGAVEQLEHAYAAHHTERADLGIFGNGLPEGIVAATGAQLQHVHVAPEPELDITAAGIAAFMEPFLDAHVRIFLHRLFAGRFDHLKAIVFCRDDAPALLAYQYALELGRLGFGSARMPRLLLWNMVHKQGAAAARFNLVQLDRLWLALSRLGCAMPETEALRTSAAAEYARAVALGRLEELRKHDAPGIDGASAMRWRNAGRYLTARRHCELLEAALDGLSRRGPREGARIGLVGSQLDCAESYATIEAFGTIVCDLQPLGEVWPLPGAGEPNPQTVLAAAAADPFCPRSDPPARFVDAMVERCVEARCDVVLAQLGANDDSFGWDVPGLRHRLEENGIALIDLGFRDHRPAPEWLASVRQALGAHLGASA